MSAAASEMSDQRAQLAMLLERGFQSLPQINNRVRQIDGLHSLFCMKRDAAEMKIKEVGQLLSQQLALVQAELERELTCIFKEKEKLLFSLKEKLLGHFRKIARGCSDIEEVLEFDKEEELKKNGYVLASNLEQVLINKMASAVELEAEVGILDFIPTPPHQDLSAYTKTKFGYIRCSALDPRSVQVCIMEDQRKAFVNIEETVLIKAAPYHILDGAKHITAIVKDPEGMPSLAKIVDNSDGTYSVSYTPEMDGPHCLYVSVYGYPVSGSPFIIHVEEGPDVDRTETDVGIPRECEIERSPRRRIPPKVIEQMARQVRNNARINAASHSGHQSVRPPPGFDVVGKNVKLQKASGRPDRARQGHSWLEGEGRRDECSIIGTRQGSLVRRPHMDTNEVEAEHEPNKRNNHRQHTGVSGVGSRGRGSAVSVHSFVPERVVSAPGRGRVAFGWQWPGPPHKGARPGKTQQQPSSAAKIGPLEHSQEMVASPVTPPEQSISEPYLPPQKQESKQNSTGISLSDVGADSKQALPGTASDTSDITEVHEQESNRTKGTELGDQDQMQAGTEVGDQDRTQARTQQAGLPDVVLDRATLEDVNRLPGAAMVDTGTTTHDIQAESLNDITETAISSKVHVVTTEHKSPEKTGGSQARSESSSDQVQDTLKSSNISKVDSPEDSMLSEDVWVETGSMTGETTVKKSQRSCEKEDRVASPDLHKAGGKAVEGRLLCVIGRQGKDRDRNVLYFPIGVAITSTKDVIVCDSANNSVKCWNWLRDDKAQFKWAIHQYNRTRFYRPSAVVVNKDDDIFVKDNAYIFKINKYGRALFKFGGEYLNKPFGMVMTRQGELVVLDHAPANPGLVIFDQEGIFLRRCPFTPVAQSQMQTMRCRFMTIYKDELFITDLGRNAVYKTGLDGHVHQTFGRYGSKSGEFHEPSGITVDCMGNLVVADSKNNRLQVYKGSDGSYMTTIHTDECILRPSDTHLTPDGHLLVANFLEHCVKIFQLEV